MANVSEMERRIALLEAQIESLQAVEEFTDQITVLEARVAALEAQTKEEE